MKKYILVYCFVIIVFQLKAQDYSLFKPYSDYIYTDGNTVHFDSTYVLGADSVFLNYAQLDQNNYTYNRNTWFCSSVIKSSQNEWLIIYNYDSVFTFKPETNIDSSWVLYQFQNGNKIMATVDSTVFTNVISMDDSVKYISLQLKDSLNNNLSSNINQAQILIAKQLGLIKFPVWQNLLNGNGTTTNLLGCSNPAIGLQNFTAIEAFDMEIGDEVISHQTGSWTPFSRYTKRKVISKNFSNNIFTYIDSVFVINQTDPVANSLYSVVQNNTVIRSIDLSSDYYKVWRSLNNEGIVDSNNAVVPVLMVMQDLLCLPIKSQKQLGYTIIDSLGTVQQWVGGLPTNYVFKGLGEIYYTPPYPMGDTYFPVYYKKGAETCGTWVDFQYLLTGISEPKNSLETVTINPNPAHNFITINNPQKDNIDFVICDIMGKKVLQAKVVNQSEIINLEHLPGGIYIVNLNNNSKSKLIINH